MNAASITVERIKRQLAALGCEKFIITLRRPVLDESGQPVKRPATDRKGNPRLDSNGNQVIEIVEEKRNLCKHRRPASQWKNPLFPESDVIPWTLADLLDRGRLAHIKYENAQGYAVYITPHEERGKRICILVDDIKPNLIEAYGPPNSLCETSPGNFQAVYSLPFTHDRQLYLDLFNFLNLKHGDENITALRHAFRLAEFSNQKSKYRRLDGTFPFVKLKSARTSPPVKMLEFVEKCASGEIDIAGEVARLRAEKKQRDAGGQDTGQEFNDTASAPALPRRPRPAANAPDFRADDYTAALYAAWDGLGGEDLEKYVAEHSEHVKNPCGYDLNFDEYIKKTAANAEDAVTAAREKIADKWASRKPAPRPSTRVGYNKSVFLKRPWPPKAAAS